MSIGDSWSIIDKGNAAIEMLILRDDRLVCGFVPIKRIEPFKFLSLTPSIAD